MKIAFILPSLAFVGPILVAKYIIDELSKEHEIDVYYFDNKVELEINANLFKINLFHPIDFKKYTIIHTHMLRPDFYLFFWSMVKKFSAVRISTIHQNISHDQRTQRSYFTAKLVTGLWHTFLGSNNAIVTLNYEMYTIYKQLYPNIKVSNIFNGIPEIKLFEEIPQSDLLKISKLKSEYICIGAAARIVKIKGFEQIIEVLPLLKDFCFICIGDGEELEKLKKLAQKNNTIDRVLFLGKRNNARIYFKYFDIFAMTSSNEGAPISLLEASSLGIPSICTNIPVLNKLFNQNEVSFFEYKNISSLKDAIIYAHKNSSKFSINIRKRFQKSYTSKIMAKEYLNFYILNLK